MQLTCTVDLAEMRVCSDNSGQIYQTLFNKIRAPDRNEKGQNVIKIIVEILFIPKSIKNAIYTDND